MNIVLTQPLNKCINSLTCKSTIPTITKLELNIAQKFFYELVLFNEHSLGLMIDANNLMEERGEISTTFWKIRD